MTAPKLRTKPLMAAGAIIRGIDLMETVPSDPPPWSMVPVRIIRAGAMAIEVAWRRYRQVGTDTRCRGCAADGTRLVLCVVICLYCKDGYVFVDYK